MKGTVCCIVSIALVTITGADPRPAGVDPTDRLLQLGCLDVTKAPYLADARGIKDSTQAIQLAVNEARNHGLVCFFPEGTGVTSEIPSSKPCALFVHDSKGGF